MVARRRLHPSLPRSPEAAFPDGLAVPSGLSRVAFRAMGTDVLALVPKACSKEAHVVVKGLFDFWERTLSRFDPESELSRVNARAGSWTPVSPLFLEVASAALQAAQATSGLFDPTLQRRLVALGYDRSFERIRKGAAAGASGPFSLGQWRRVAMDAAGRRVRLPPGAGFDFGGIAKGMAVDAALSRLKELGAVPCLVDAGGDLAVAGQPPGGAWPIGGALGTRAVLLTEGALATSGTQRRRWRQGFTERHHLIDPQSGMPAEGIILAVTVAAGDCMRAEVAAKVAFLLGPEKGRVWLERNGLAGCFVLKDGTRPTSSGWPKGEVQ